jgi:hypothetical protein
MDTDGTTNNSKQEPFSPQGTADPRIAISQILQYFPHRLCTIAHQYAKSSLHCAGLSYVNEVFFPAFIIGYLIFRGPYTLVTILLYYSI